MPSDVGPGPDLLLLAVRYVGGELSSDECEALESRLGNDQTAREAVAEAVELAGALALLRPHDSLVLPLRRARPLRRWMGAAAACLALALGAGLLARRPVETPSAPPQAAAAPSPSDRVALAWSGLRQTGEVDLVSHTELLAWLDDSGMPPAADVLTPGSGESGDDSLSSWLVEAAQLRERAKPAAAGPREN